MTLRELFKQNGGYNYFKNTEGNMYVGWQYLYSIMDAFFSPDEICDYNEEDLEKEIRT